MADASILVVDDEPAIRDMIAVALEVAGFECLRAENARVAHALIIDKQPDLVLLDWMMPETSGLELLRRLRRDELTANLPVILLTAKTEEDNQVQGLDAGADDYVAKPFHLEEVLARIRALLRRSAGHAQSELTCGPVSLDTRTGRVSVSGNPIKMTSHEYRLLAYLMHHTGRVVSRTELVEHLYDQDFDRGRE